MLDLSDFFLTIYDPRVDRTKKHSLCKLIGLGVYGSITGANSWKSIEIVCEERQKELAKIMDLENGIPSHDTFQRVFSRLDPKSFADGVAAWMKTFVELNDKTKQHIALDGKMLRSSFDTANGQSALRTLNAFIVDNLTILRHEVDTEKDSKIKMIPELLNKIDLKNAIVSIDAIGCQKDIVKQIRKKKGDYLIALKDNQPNLLEETKSYFEYAKHNTLDETTYSIHQTTEKGHGRIENRSYFCLDTKYFPLEYGQKFTDIATIIQVSRTREKNGEQFFEKQFYISSLDCNAKHLGDVIRGHWAIENSLHYVLDVTYCEDDNRTRKDHAPANFSLLRKVALSLINLRKDKKLSQKKARLKAMLNHSYAIFLLTGSEVKNF